MSSRRMNPTQLQVAYRHAVESSLVTFYRKTEIEAKRLVDDWWRRMSPQSDIDSQMYLHSEALTVAADLARKDEVELTDSVRQLYRRILQQSTCFALEVRRAPAKHVKRAAPLKQMVG